MTETQKPPSYTQQLKDHLESNKCPKKYIDLVSTFALEYSTKIDEQKKTTEGIITFGKYKGKKFEDVYTLDKPYIKWMMKNNKYLSSANKQIVEDLLKEE